MILIIMKKVYSKNEFYQNELISVERLIVNERRTIARIKISPFAYNPMSNP